MSRLASSGLWVLGEQSSIRDDQPAGWFEAYLQDPGAAMFESFKANLSDQPGWSYNFCPVGPVPQLAIRLSRTPWDGALVPMTPEDEQLILHPFGELTEPTGLNPAGTARAVTMLEQLGFCWTPPA